MRFGAVGVVSTLAYLLLFTALRTGAGAQAANLIALLVTRDRKHRRQPAVHASGLPGRATSPAITLRA